VLRLFGNTVPVGVLVQNGAGNRAASRLCAADLYNRVFSMRRLAVIRLLALPALLSAVGGAQTSTRKPPTAIAGQLADSTTVVKKTPVLDLINRLDELVELRFKTPIAGVVGISRITTPSSMGKQFHPNPANSRDLMPENMMEKEVIAKLEEHGVQVGFYMFGIAIVRAIPELLDYRSLKGPAAITRGTPRPGWYPNQLPDPRIHTQTRKAVSVPAGPLPDWNAVYPLARRAMLSFQGGSAGFETTLASWDVAARPVSTEKRCAACHDLSHPIGGVLYAFRRAKR
jgi:hypothetical protein